MKKALVATLLMVSSAFTTTAFAAQDHNKAGARVTIGRGGISIGIGVGRGHGPRGGWYRQNTCVARNFRGQTFVGRAFNQSQARNEALRNCNRVSRFNCRIQYCN